ncbi:protein FAM124A-like [Stylophora pistillata]|uniref:protein FAM124A-like n=1 Tax=Stylophora pistillata TaxID=50429 RepID=UPI000C04A71D|nr:protein FAM124A-like [Stylophora pistillata]XP_022781689.1 protein FAM124A-like [Stylophora pistillata]XP_022781690.1 protein FAM124A-like [Stylophora pistillata]XP_022781691.1 protein FAM124A-like [Stylophora pistillata]
MEEEFASNDEGFDENILEEENFQAAPDPYNCTLQIYVRGGEANSLKRLFSPFLEGMDPTFQFISIDESNDGESALDSWKDENDDPSILQCQAISIVLFLYETFGRLSASYVQNKLNFLPWKFHHRVELPADARPRVTALQDFYQTFPGLPLWSICPVHFGNEHLRFHIFTRNFIQMRSFYEVLTAKKAISGSPGFCFFTLYSQSGFDVQLSLKHLPQICPKPSKSVRLKLKIKDIDTILPHLGEQPLLQKEDGRWIVTDPDGNELILEETDPSHARTRTGRLHSSTSLETSDYDTASIDTESLAGSMNHSPHGTLNASFLESFTLL